MKKFICYLIPSFVYCTTFILIRFMCCNDIVMAMLNMLYSIIGTIYILNLNFKYINNKEISFFRGLLYILIIIKAHVIYVAIHELIIRGSIHNRIIYLDFYSIYFWLPALFVFAVLFLWNKKQIKKFASNVPDKKLYQNNIKVLLVTYIALWFLKIIHRIITILTW